MATRGWFVFDTSSLSGSYEYFVDARDYNGAAVNSAYGTFATGNPNSVSALIAYSDRPDIVHFFGQDAAKMLVSYRTSGSTGTYATVWATKVGTGAFDWDASNLVTNRSVNYDYEYLFETFDSGNTTVNKAHGTVRLGASPSAPAPIPDNISATVRFNPEQTNATKLVLSYRTNGSTGAFTNVTLTRASSTQPFVWDSTTGIPSGNVSLDYYYVLGDSANNAVTSPDGNAIRVDGVINLTSAGATPTQLKWIILGTNKPQWSITHRQSYNAFGEIAQEGVVVQETDQHLRATNFRYNTLGKLLEKREPDVPITLQNGFVTHGQPTTTYTYDLAGRLISLKDPNGNVNSQKLLDGTGLGEDDPLVSIEFHADGGKKRTDYDIFGNARVVTDEDNRVTLQEFDKLGRVTKMTRPTRAANTPSNETGAAVSPVDTF